MKHTPAILMALTSQITLVAHDSTVKEYRYTDPSTWPAIERFIGQLTINPQSIKNMHTVAVVAFHLIWQTKDFILAQKLLNQLMQKNYSCKNMINYLQGKLYSFTENYEKALASYGQINFDAQDDEKNALSAMLKTIGSYNSSDPDGIELDLLHAIITNEIANIHLEQKAYDEAVRGFSAAFTILKKAYLTTKHANIAYTLRRLGIAYAKKGDILNAKDALHQALKICKNVYTDQNHPEFHAVMTSLEQLKHN